MTARKRILSLFLCVVMLIPCFTELFPVVLSAEDDGVITLYVTYEGEQTTEISLIKTERAEISAYSANIDVNAYRWQICYDTENNGWAYIYDKAGKTIEISRGLFETIADSEYAAYIRAVTETDFGRVYSAPVRVVLTDKPEPEPVLPPAAPKKLPFKSLLKLGAAPAATYNIKINYLDAEAPGGNPVYTAFEAHLDGTSSYSQTVLTPVRVGYTPFWTTEEGEPKPADGAVVTITRGGETREYTYDASNDTYTNNATDSVETDSQWITALRVKAIDEAATTSADSIYVSFDPADPKDVTYNVYYKPADVPFSVRYYFQNINDDGYTQNASISYSGMAKTGTIVSDAVLEQPVIDALGTGDIGFTPLYHYPEAVSADGSTVFECYYDRNYYLYKFDMDGGYGVEPVYARYESSFVVPPPTKAGYVFMGWDEVTQYWFDVYADVNGTQTRVGSVYLTPEQYAEQGSPSAYMGDYDNGVTTYENAVFRFSESKGNGTPDEAVTGTDNKPQSFIGTVGTESKSYKALWTTTTANVTVVYWKENANDNNYSFWGIDNFTATSATTVNGADHQTLPTALANESDSNQFYYDHADSSVFVEGDGTSIVNVYYKRALHTITFYDTTTCKLDQHVHTDACYGYLCGEHVHTEDCLICTLPELPHTAECCSIPEHTHTSACGIVCPIPEHTHDATCNTINCIHVHNADCCSIEFHDHTSGCTYTEQLSCPYEELHTHTVACYTVTGKYGTQNRAISIDTANGVDSINNIRTDSSTGVNLYYNYWNGNNPLYVEIEGRYYPLKQNGNNISYSNVSSIKSLSVSMTCSKTEHTAHDESCYICPGYAHTHSVTCYPNATTTEATNTQKYGAPNNPQNGQIYRRGNGYTRIIYYNGSWYQYGGTEGSGTVLSMNCGKVEHTHAADGSCCTKTVHDHTSGCVYTDASCHHVCSLENGCIKRICGYVVEHTHTEACTHVCGKVAHTHDDDCCGIEEHTHLRSCLSIGGRYRRGFNDYYSLSLSTTGTNIENVATTVVNGVTLYYNSIAGTNDQYLYVKAGDWYYRVEYYRNGTQQGVTYANSNNLNYDNNKITLTYTCGKVEHTHDGTSCNYTCGKEEHVHNDSCYICGLTEHTHGVDECNGDNCTDPTHHRHTDECYGCGYTSSSHVHTADCPVGLTCGYMYEHVHTADCNRSDRKNAIYKVTAKYDSDISQVWESTGVHSSSPVKGYLDDGYVWQSSVTGSYYSFLEKIPAYDVDMTATQWSGNLYTWYYYLEVLSGMDTTGLTLRTDGGRTYYLYHSTSVKGNGISLTYDEDYFPITGFTQRDGTVPEFNSSRVAYLYYLRNSKELKFVNADGTVLSTQMLPYQKPLDSYVSAMGTPAYPSTFEPGAYSFEGWYTTPRYFAGTEYVPGTTMPEGSLALYAKWIPVTHTVRFFETYDIMLDYEARAAAIKADVSLTDAAKATAIEALDDELVYVKATMPDEEYKRFVEHGSFVGSIPNPDKLLVTNPGGSTSEYDFGGWFMIENENKKAFTPLDMPVTKDLNIFADWGTHTAQPYRISYALDEAEDDSTWTTPLGTASAANENKEKTVTVSGETRTYICLDDDGSYGWHLCIAADTRGYAYQGTTRTFNAKAGESYHQLYDATYSGTDFNAGYYPMPSSHSITMVYEEDSIEPVYNVFTFRYVNVTNVDYWIRYIDTSTGERMKVGGETVEDVRKNTTKAVVTERFRPFTDYLPDASYKQCILAVIPDPEHPGEYIASPENVITFYYTPDENAAKYTVHFLLQKADEASETLNASDYIVTFNTDGTYNVPEKFEESGSRIDGIADKDTNTPITPPTDFAGFDFVKLQTSCYDITYNASTDKYTAASASFSWNGNDCVIVPHTGGTDLFFFYKRETYKYKVYYLRYGTPVTATDLVNYTTVTADTHDPKWVLADTKTKDEHDNDLTALYGRNFTENAKKITGYTCVSSQTITKAITPVEANNYIVFFYTPEQYTVQYVIIDEDGNVDSEGERGELDKTIETIQMDDEDNDEFAGSLATAKIGYKFDGWFVKDPNGNFVPASYDSSTNPYGKGTTYTDKTKTSAESGANGKYVLPVIDPNLIPNNDKRLDPAEGGDPDANTFYAMFSPTYDDLTIVREKSANEGYGTQVFVYEVKNTKTNETVYVTIAGENSVTIHGLQCGSYKVTQINKDWSHRFDDEAQDVTLVPDGTTVTFDDDAVTEQWLNGNGPRAVNTRGEEKKS